MIFQGVRRKQNYFEGWYHKHVSPKGYAYAIIGGLAFAKDRKGHSFVQVIRGSDGSSSYVFYPIEEFQYDHKKYSIGIGPNLFSRSLIRLAIKTPTLKLAGELSYHDPIDIKRSLIWPGIMGWYRFVPLMECYHGVVSLYHSIKGELSIEGEDIDFTGGIGYIEKDWGSSMPSNWIWIQGNSFPSPKTCFMLSVATIPWMGSSFIGFLGVFHTRGKEYRFATYTGARIKNIHIAGEEVTIQLFNKKYNCKIRARRSSTGFLKAPVFGDMERRIAESIDATVEIQIEKRENNEVIFQERSPYAGLELVGDISKLSWQLTSDSKNQRVSSLL